MSTPKSNLSLSERALRKVAREMLRSQKLRKGLETAPLVHEDDGTDFDAYAKVAPNRPIPRETIEAMRSAVNEIRAALIQSDLVEFDLLVRMLRQLRDLNEIVTAIGVKQGSLVSPLDRRIATPGEAGDSEAPNAS